jgi:A/G-specific adenine glycosylase
MKVAASKSKIDFFQQTLLTWYKTNARIFVWRRKGLSNYEYIIAEILLQRTKAETVQKFYDEFVVKFPGWKQLAAAKQEKLEEALKPIGLYRQRSYRLIHLAHEMVKRNGELPNDRKDLEAIPFMGQYIANAVELIIFNQPAPLIDVNMARLLERFFGPRNLADIRYDPYLQSLAKRVVNHENSKEINWAILDFAASICTARNPKHDACPLRSKCFYVKTKKAV